MLIKKPADIPSSEITPQRTYLNRRQLLAGGAAALGAAGLWELAGPGESVHAGTKLANVQKSSFSTTEKQTPYDVVTHYNNFYEFGTAKEQPAELSKNWRPAPDWKVSVEGLAGKPRTFGLDEIMKLGPLEERIYRMRCVEGWSMVIPWVGLPLSSLLKQVDPLGKAKYVAFESFYNSKQMPYGNYAGIAFPYVEGLRLDEAMNPLTTLAVGLYGETLPNQNGAPIRLVVPWKYGFKGIKSIVKIKLTDKQPPSTWNLSQPSEYGFYSNVNPEVDHPRWSQAKERRLGEFLKRNTLMFNGYGDQVASLYSGLDLRKNF